ncbi:MAG: hypothetical protein R2857_00450 [Vampirovibrionales bacterium]
MPIFPVQAQQRVPVNGSGLYSDAIKIKGGVTLGVKGDSVIESMSLRDANIVGCCTFSRSKGALT